MHMSKDILINNKEESRVLKAVKTKEKSVLHRSKCYCTAVEDIEQN